MSAHAKRMRLSLRVHPAGLLMLAMAFFFLRSDLVLAAVLALLCHEGAHLLAMSCTGVPACSVELTPFGGMADAACYERLPGWKQLFIALSGVAVSAAAGLLCVRFAPRFPFWYAFANMNLSLALLNCLPVWPLDGARAVMAIASRFGAEAAARRLMLWLAYVLSAAMVGLGLYGAWYGHVNLSLLLLGPYLAYAARESSVSSSVRRMSRAQSPAEKLAKGRVAPVRALACEGEPTPLMLTRLMARMPPQCFHMLHVIDHTTGKLLKTISEQEMAGILFSDSSSSPKE